MKPISEIDIFTPETLRPLHKKLCDHVLAAGDVALSFYKKSPEVKIKPDGSLVSEADFAVDAYFRNVLPDLDPEIGWLSEESGNLSDRHGKKALWMLDPIDGTRAFVNGKDEWTISLALVAQGKPVLASVYNPSKEEFFDAISAGGARLNGAPISVSSHSTIENARLFVPDHMRAKFTDYNYTALRAGSIAYRISLVAAGLAEATFSNKGSHDWDIAAAHLILEEAGGKMTNIARQPMLYNQSDIFHDKFLSSNAALNEILFEIMKK